MDIDLSSKNLKYRDIDKIIKYSDSTVRIHGIYIFKNRTLISQEEYIISRIIGGCLRLENLEVPEDPDCIQLLDFINWNCNLLFDHDDIWMDETDGASYASQLVRLAYKNQRYLTNIRKRPFVTALVETAFRNEDKYARKLIIKRNVKLCKHNYLQETDSIIFEARTWFIEHYNYELWN